MNSKEYITEKQRRGVRALMHWEAMQDKYSNEEDKYGVGFRKWSESPLPHYYLYGGYFLLLLAEVHAYELLPTLEDEFYGDGIDLDYIEGLLLSYEEVGVLTNLNAVAVDDSDGAIILLDSQGNAIKERLGFPKRLFTLEQNRNLAARFKIIRKWIKRKRAAAEFVEVHQTLHDAKLFQELWGDDTAQDNGSTAEDNSQPVNRIEAAWKSLLYNRKDFSLTKLDELLLKMELINNLEDHQPEPAFKGSVIVGVIQALREKQIIVPHDHAKLARVLGAYYTPYAANFYTVGRHYDYDSLKPEAKKAYSDAMSFLPTIL